METNRHIFGLDFYRAAAILMVLLANTIYLFQFQFPALAQCAPVMGYIGLEIFFVLSGFLLGKSLYALFASENFVWNDALVFIKRKLLRIAPLYFLILLINLAIAVAMHYPVYFAWKYFLFAQNFSSTIPPFFPESWGLPVIVFAMTALPLVLFGFSKIVRQEHKQLAFPVVVTGFLSIFFWTKWLYNSVHPVSDITQWEASLRTVAVYRFDSVLIGVLFGWLFVKRSVFCRRAKWLFAFLGFAGVGFLAVGVGFLQLTIDHFPAFWNIYYLPLTSLILACFLPLLSTWETASFLRKPITLLSNSAYSIYLIHFSIVLLLMEHFLMKDASANNLIFLAMAYFAVTIFIGYLVSRFVENGFLKRWKP